MLNNFVVGLKKYTFTEKSVPWVLLAACTLAFGMLIPQLGFYQDDWVYVYNHYLYGDRGIIEFLQFDGRPFAAWVYILGFKLLGYKPIAWHLAALILKWLTVTSIWATFRTIWPQNEWRNLTAGLIFALYPFFTLQPLAVAYSLHWMGYLLYGLSLYFMVQSLNQRFWLYTVLALLTQTIQIFSLEYFAGIELLRPVILWIILSAPDRSVREKTIGTLKRWAPYLIVFVIFFVWRGFIFQAPEAGRNAPSGLLGLLNSPISTIISITLNAIPDIILLLVSSWYKILEPNAFDFSASINRYAAILALLVFFISLFYLSRRQSSNDQAKSPTRQMFLVGGFALLFGLIPAYAAGYVMHTKLAPWNSRFSLGSLFGAALIITALIDILVKTPRTRWLLLSALLGLLVGWQLRSTNDFRWAWDKQVNFYRQLYLRAPALEPGTALLSEEEFVSFMGNYSTSYGINLIYAPKKTKNPDAREADTWLFTYADFSSNVDEYLDGTPFSIGTDTDTPRAGVTFQGDKMGSVAILFEPERGQCLWIMRPEYATSKTLSQTTRLLSRISYVDRIQQAPPNPDSFLLKYLYPKQEQDWCFYYEQADLAYQYEEWGQVVQLWEAATQAGKQPENGFEYLPFIEAFAYRGDWESAKRMTRASQKTMQGIDPLLCDIWSKLENDTAASPERETAVSSVKEDLRCGQE